MRAFWVVAFGCLLSSCETAEPEGAPTVMLDGVSYAYRHTEYEPENYRLIVTAHDTVDVSVTRGLRIADAPDGRTANRVMGVICGIDPAAAESYGDHGDPVGRDETTGEYIYWLDCRSGTIAD